MKRRIVCILLALLLLLPLFPPSPGADAASPGVWERIYAIEDSVSAKRSLSAAVSARAFTAALDEITEAILSAPDVLPDSLFQNGDALYWRTTDGTACGYLPSLRAEARTGAVAAADEPPEDTQSYAVRGGVPGSVDVSVFQPYYGLDSNFTQQYQKEAASVAEELGGYYHLYKTTEATIDNIAHALETSAVVFFDSHGKTDYENGSDSVSRANTSYLCLQTNAGFTQEDMRRVSGLYGSYYHAFYAGSYGKMNFYCADGTAIANHMTQSAPNNFLWSAICLGMATEGMCAPLREKGVGVVYGYTESVTFKADYRWEEEFWGKMKDGGTVAGAAAHMKQTVGTYDRYDDEGRPARPVFVSAEDTYPGRDHLKEEQSVRSPWQLYSPYRLRVTVNDQSLGTVSVVGSQITLYPKEHCLFEGWELVSGSAEIVQNGDLLYVYMQSDCTVRVDFAPMPEARLLLCTPRQSEQYVFDSFVGLSVTLPGASDLSEGFDNLYSFCGWTTSPCEKSAELPQTVYPAGTAYPLTESTQTLYALYSFTEKTEPVYAPVTTRPREWATPYDWTGSYVIVHTTEEAQYALDHNGAAIPLSSTGFTLEDEKLSQVDERFVFRLLKTDGGYLIARSSDLYCLAGNEDESLSFLPPEQADSALWTPDYIAFEYVHIGAKAIKSGYLAHYSGDGRFCCKKYYQCNLTLYREEDPPTLYTTEPKVPQECAEHSFTDWEQLVAPSCTQSGVEGRSCTVCGYCEQRTLLTPGHRFSESGAISPTCTEEGRTANVVCALCGLVQQASQALPALGHAWDGGSVLRQAEQTSPGLIAYVCTVCGRQKTQLLSCLASLSCEGGESCFGSVFSDMPACGSWAHLPIDWAIANGITNGMSADRFCPDNSCTRGQIVTFLWRAAGQPETAGQGDPFRDVNSTLYCYESVLWAVSQGITTGVTADEFRPNDVCTRAQVVTFLWRFAGQPPAAEAGNPFSDVPASAYYTKAVLWAASQGITNGTGAGSFSPSAPCTRAQVVAFLYRTIES